MKAFKPSSHAGGILWVIFTLGFFVLGGSLVGCGGGSGGSGSGGDEANPSESISSIDDLSQAVIRIVAQGAFEDPTQGSSVGTGSGSGFFIDPSGLAVTNNHVVTGAATLEIYVSGENTPRHASVLGVSECSDLAVIDVDGEGFEFLAWFEDDIEVGQTVFAAGFPLGEPEFTLTNGIIAKIDSQLASALSGPENVIQHTADLQPGNSGGPLVSDTSKVVGVNYLGIPAPGGMQFFAIAAEEAKPLVEELKEGEDVTSIGINGQAIQLGDGTKGVWVSAVKSGSPADAARIRAGDVLLTLEGLPLGADGTITDYCQILRSHRPTDPLNIRVLRPSTLEILEGVLNERPLEVISSPISSPPDTGPTPNPPPSPPSPATSNGSYVTITDASGVLSIDVPEAWTDTQSGPLTVAEMAGLAIYAAPNIDQFLSRWDVSGVLFWASRSLAGYPSADAILDDPQLGLDFSGSCTYEERSSVEDSEYVGKMDAWTNCGNVGTTFLVLAEKSKDGDHGVIIEVQIVAAFSDFNINFGVNGALP